MPLSKVSPRVPVAWLGRYVGLSTSSLGSCFLTPPNEEVRRRRAEVGEHLLRWLGGVSGEGVRHKHTADLILTDGWFLISLNAISATLLRLITGLPFPSQSQSPVQSWLGLVIHTWYICLALFRCQWLVENKIRWGVLASQGKSMELSCQACWRCCACIFFH